MVVVTGGYPSPARPTHMTFVKQFVHAFARQGVLCTVIHPVGFHDCRVRNRLPYRSEERSSSGEPVLVLRPRFVSLSVRAGFSRLGSLNPGLITFRNFTGAVRRTLARERIQPDALYGHFLYLPGATAAIVGRELGVPVFPGVGESVAPGESIWTLMYDGVRRLEAVFESVHGVVVNSTLLKAMVMDQLQLPGAKIGVFPNGVDLSRFHPREKGGMREKYGFPRDLCLVACTGQFSHRKGQQRILDAIRGLDRVGAVFIGGGAPPTTGAKICYNDRVPHDRVPEILSACDLFVLPTLGEGSSNAIIEAMACGLPVVSSIGAFNDDLLTEDMSIRVDPLSVEEIRGAILRLRDDAGLHRAMAAAALRQSARFDIDERARRILQFMEERL